MKKTIVLVLSSSKDPWLSIETNGIRQTWSKLKNNNITTIFYYGGCSKQMFLNNNFYSTINDSLFNIGYRTLEVFDFVYKNFEFDYLFRTNTSSYVDLNLLNVFVNNNLKDSIKYFYGGQRVYYPQDKFDFMSGCGYFLSSNLVKFILEKRNEWNHSLIDDVALGSLLLKHNIEFNDTDRYDFKSINDMVPLNYYHYRCKISNNRVDDVKIMKRIHEEKGYV